MRKTSLILFCIYLVFAVNAGAQEESDRAVNAQEIMERAERIMRSDTAFSEFTMKIITPDWERKLTLRSWDDRLENRSFIHILSPARDQDTTFLRLDGKLWMYLPRAERVIKIPPSMMLQNWMGSDFTNDDLVKESSYITDYEHEFKGIESIEDQECYTIILTPRENAPVTWGRVVVSVRIDPFVPVRYQYFNKRGELRKEMIMSNIQEMGGKVLPVEWTMYSTGKEGFKTVILLNAIEFDVKFQDSMFSQRHLKNPR